MKNLVFSKNQQIMQKPGEDHRDLHEKLRESATKSIIPIKEPTQIVCQSWYSYDASGILSDIPNAVGICTSTCKHEMPYQIFVGRRHEGWQRAHPTKEDTWIYLLDGLGRDLTPIERNTIYDHM